MSARFDWAGLMRAGFRELRLTPPAFWALTPHELLVMLGREAGGGAMAHTRLMELAAAYPDAQPQAASKAAPDSDPDMEH